MKVVVQDKEHFFEVYRFVDVIQIVNGELVIIQDEDAKRIDLTNNITITN